MKRIMVIPSFIGETRHVDVSDDNQLHSTCLSILNERFSEGYYIEPREPIKPKITTQKAKDLPDDNVKRFISNQWQHYNQLMKTHTTDLEEWDSIKKAIDTNDGEIAFQCLLKRKDRHGESLSIHEVLDKY